jgi:diketogulonate reductase-like aldo/keto reductase
VTLDQAAFRCLSCLLRRNREELFITSKVFNNHHQDRAAGALRNTLKNLQLSYLVWLSFSQITALLMLTLTHVCM